MFCPNCGATNADEARFCSRCGFPLGAPQPSDGGQMNDPQMNSPQWNDPQMNSPQWNDPQMNGPQWNDPQTNGPAAAGTPANGPAPAAPKAAGIPLLYKILIPVLSVAAIVLLVLVIGRIRESRKEPSVTAESTTVVSGKEGQKPGSDAGKDSTQSAPAAQSAASSAETPAGNESTAQDGQGGAESQAPQPSGGEPAAAVVLPPVQPMERPSFFKKLGFVTTATGGAPSVAPYTWASDLSDVGNVDDFYLSAGGKAALAQNGFFVLENGGGDEFFSTYEMNRYSLKPNFVTVDSMMHTYHLYFQYLLKNTERTGLSQALTALSGSMLAKSAAQLEALRGTEWETAAKRNTAFFAVGASLLNASGNVPADLSDLVAAETAMINGAGGIGESAVLSLGLGTPVMEDYSQYIVRGYYEGDPTLERYFRAMMWYGRLNFAQNDEDLTRSAFLITLALDADTLPNWEAIYSVTSFFAGASDDNGYYEYKPLIDAAYGTDVSVSSLPGNGEAWNTFYLLTAQTEPPRINSVPGFDDGTDHTAENKGFRFMGQRFSIDAVIFQNLIYSRIGENSTGERRMLPDALDIPAALGSDAALSILTVRGAAEFAGYSENMEKLRSEIAASPDDLWTASLYSKWLDTLRPILEVKGAGYPPFMQTDAWTRKNLQTFLGSYTELKHDTVLYSKQTIAEMGGDDYGVKDDRGYVEPEPEVFGRLSALVQATSEGLASYGFLSAEDAQNLALLQELAERLRVIAEKELRNELPTDDEFELIRSYGGQLEHFWQEVYKGETTETYFTSRNFPAAIVTDVATDPNGTVLELGTGRSSDIYVIVSVGGSLRVASGTVYTFYQFEHPMNDRLTDSKWRQMLGIHAQDNGTYVQQPEKKTEDWTDDFQYTYYELQ